MLSLTNVNFHVTILTLFRKLSFRINWQSNANRNHISFYDIEIIWYDIRNNSSPTEKNMFAIFNLNWQYIGNNVNIVCVAKLTSLKYNQMIKY